jgi:hypothetical protein
MAFEGIECICSRVDGGEQICKQQGLARYLQVIGDHFHLGKNLRKPAAPQHGVVGQAVPCLACADGN